ncbi:GNAT family N-acetyltransferase [Reinekea sp. G2M2-21]|uniref:GNAT family N-acetyltransferase n=1 Tax=Reinekea sp. G2M2-21 TaxID=2788942 RepID=UPI0018A98740|nr:GNAT family N-acetyltransferase [Reinekea sp. G2M2-21]
MSSTTQDSASVMARIQVSLFDPGHIEQAQQLWQASPGVGLSDSDHEENLARFLQRNPSTSFVALQQDSVVGTVLCGHDGRRGYVHHLAVAQTLRRQGIGTTLLDCALHALYLDGIHKCHCFVFRDNPARDLFWNKGHWTYRKDLVVYSSHTR